MKVKDVMIKEVITVKKEATYKEVAELLVKHKISAVPVVDEANQVIGIISEKDLLRIMYPYYSSFVEHPELYTNLEERENKIKEIANHPVESFMTREVFTISPEAPILEAGARMLAKRINRLPVMENSKLVGIVTRRDIYQMIFKQYLLKKK